MAAHSDTDKKAGAPTWDPGPVGYTLVKVYNLRNPYRREYVRSETRTGPVFEPPKNGKGRSIRLTDGVVYPNISHGPPWSLELGLGFVSVRAPSDFFPPLGCLSWVTPAPERWSWAGA
jgi:hypothetical protein